MEFFVVYLQVGYNGITEAFLVHYHLSFKLKMQRHIIVKNIVIVRSLKHPHSVSRGRAAGNVGFREIHIDAEKHFGASLHQKYSYSSWRCHPYRQPSTPCLDGALEGHKQAELLLGSPAPAPKHTHHKNIRKPRRSENQVQMCSCAKKT